MTGNIERLLKFYIIDKEHHKYRQPKKADPYFLAKEYRKENLSDMERVVRRFEYMTTMEQPVVFRDEKISMLRTVSTIPEIYTREEWSDIKAGHYIHEQGKVCNINPSYIKIIQSGFDAKRSEINQILSRKKEQKDEYGIEYLTATLRMMDAVEAFAERYRKAAADAGNTEMAEIFSHIPKKPPESFHEALQFFRLMHYCLWCSFNYHNTVGRFDQYMYPYFKKDMETGKLTKDQAFELLEEFFISFNKDSDLYTGMQQGDNGQSMVLGGTADDGKSSCNELSAMCLRACRELKLIDPKINLRVNKNTPLELYEEGTQLTKQGLGFPQYSNDDIVIPALLRWGYDKKDAYDYVVAACWEFIIPGFGMDIPNIDGFSFPDAVVKCLPLLPQCDTFNQFLDKVLAAVKNMVRAMTEKYKSVYMEPSPIMSLMMEGCIENARDISLGNKYNNYGLHGTGLSTAVDSLAAIQRYVYDEKSISAAELLKALDNDFKGYEILRNKLRYEGPKMGNNDDTADRFAVVLLNCFADSVEGIKNDRDGIYRVGTGSAMYYIWHSKGLQATPDGRNAGEAFACNYSPSLFSRCSGPVSVIKSFSKPDLKRVANGGPLTIELSDSMFRNEESIRKVAMFVKSFMDMGGHQLQINSVNRDKLLDAKKHPENYRNLIVRVWGWSGYFVELDEVYQDHIIKRTELTIE